MKRFHDVIIVGAGPAGATLARMLGEKRSVLWIEGRTWNGSAFARDKCCGGLLAPDAANWLAARGLALPERVMDSGQPLTVRAVDLHAGLARRYARRYVNLDRAAFEGWLVGLVPDAVDRAFGATCTGARRVDDGWEVQTRTPDGQTRSHAGRFLVSAEGAASSVRRLLRPGPADNAYLAVQDVYARYGGKEASRLEHVALFHPLVTDFYGWVIPKRDRVLLGAALPPRGRGTYAMDRRMRFLRESLVEAGYAFDTLIRREACLVLRPKPGDIFRGRDGAFCIGEAAGWISPSSAEGFSYAFASAEALAGAILAGGSAGRVMAGYTRRTRTLQGNILWKTVKSPFMHFPPLRGFIMRSGISARPDEAAR